MTQKEFSTLVPGIEVVGPSGHTYVVVKVLDSGEVIVESVSLINKSNLHAWKVTR